MKINSQENIIIGAMLENKNKTWWSAKEGRYRVLAIDWDREDEIEEYKQMLGE